MKRQQVHAYFRESGKLILAEHDGALWVTDSYLLFRLTDGNPVAGLLDFWNLPVEPGVYYVESNIRRAVAQTPPNVEPLLRSKDATPVARHLTCGAPTFVCSSDGKHLSAVFEHSGTGDLIAVSQRKLDVVEALAPEGEWHGAGGLKPMVRKSDSKPVALLMPIRSVFTQRERRAA